MAATPMVLSAELSDYLENQFGLFSHPDTCRDTMRNFAGSYLYAPT